MHKKCDIIAENTHYDNVSIIVIELHDVFFKIGNVFSFI